jgi:hypothetical protein
MARGFLYLVAVMDWVSRYVLAWRLSNLLDASFCNETLEEAFSHGRPRSSIPTRAASLPTTTLPACCAPMGLPSAWTAAATPPFWKSMRELIKGIAESAERLGYDVHKNDWRKRLREESSGYPCTLTHEAKVVALLPKAARARIRALELIDSFTDLRPRLEEVVSAADEWFTKLQVILAKKQTLCGAATASHPTCRRGGRMMKQRTASTDLEALDRKIEE